MIQKQVGMGFQKTLEGTGGGRESLGSLRGLKEIIRD